MTFSSRAFIAVGYAVTIGTLIYAAYKLSPYLALAILAAALLGCIYVIWLQRRRASRKPVKGVNHAKLAGLNLLASGGWIKENLRGHDEVVDDVVDAIQQELSLSQTGKVLGSFLLVGPTGTGKTFLAQLVAQALYPDSEPVLLRMNQLKHSDDVFTLIGAPPGRAGYEMGGSLTRPVSQNPYRVVIFDELDKCHPDLHDCLYDILDTGQCREKSTGDAVDFSGCVFFGTCNSGVEQLRTVLKQNDSEDARASKIRDALADASSFDKAFLARWTRVEMMDELKPLNVAEVALLQLRRYWQDFGIELTYVAPQLLLDAVEKNEEFRAYGVRQLSTYIRRQTSQAISQARNDQIKQVHLDVSPAGKLIVRHGSLHGSAEEAPSRINTAQRLPAPEPSESSPRLSQIRSAQKRLWWRWKVIAVFAAAVVAAAVVLTVFIALESHEPAQFLSAVANKYYLKPDQTGPQYAPEWATLQQRACDWGNMPSCSVLAVAYTNGHDGIAQDFIRAAALFGKVCNAGTNAHDCNAAAEIYFAGLGVDQDTQNAIYIWRRSCNIGGSDGSIACQMLAEIYDADYKEFVTPTGTIALVDVHKQPPAGWRLAPLKYIVAKNYEAAQFFWGRLAASSAFACSMGNGGSCFSAGQYYQQVRGYPEDQEKAVNYFTEACAMGYQAGCREAGNAYENGDGVVKSLDQAKADYQKGCSLGDTVSGGSCDRLKELK